MTLGKKDNEISPLKINDHVIEQVSSYKYLGVTIDDKLQWSEHINNIRSKANKRLYFVRKLGQFKVDKTLITLFYKSIIESILTFCITCWGGNSSKVDRIKLDRVIKTAGKFTSHVLHLDELHYFNTLKKISSITKDVKHPLSAYIDKSKSRRFDGYNHIMTKTERHLNSFLPTAIRFLNDRDYKV